MMMMTMMTMPMPHAESQRSEQHQRARTTLELERFIGDSCIEPIVEVPPRLQGALPPQFVLFGDLNGVVIPPRARVLDQLCRRALQSYLLSDAWLNSRRFVDSDFRAPVEYVPTLSSMLCLQFASESERQTFTARAPNGYQYALNLEVYALGLKDLLDHFKPEYYLPGPRRSAAARLQKELQRRLARYLLKRRGRK